MSEQEARNKEKQEGVATAYQQKTRDLPSIDFSTFILSMSTSALYQMGLVNGPDGAPVEEPLSLIHTSEPTRLGMISYAVFRLKKKTPNILFCLPSAALYSKH